jgi:hypothetical protein
MGHAIAIAIGVSIAFAFLACCSPSRPPPEYMPTTGKAVPHNLRTAPLSREQLLERLLVAEIGEGGLRLLCTVDSESQGVAIIERANSVLRSMQPSDQILSWDNRFWGSFQGAAGWLILREGKVVDFDVGKRQ